MALSGNLSEFGLADVFPLLSNQRKTGWLTLIQGRVRAKLEFLHGKIRGVEVNGRTPESRIRDTLLFRRRVSYREYQDLKATAEKAGADLFDILEGKEYLAREEREVWMQCAAEDLVLELFSWNEAKYRFDSAAPAPPPAPGQLLLSTDFLTLEGVRQTDEWQQIAKELGSETKVFQVVRKDYADYDLGPDQYILEVIDGERSLADVRKMLPYGRFRTYGGVHHLWKEGFLKPLGQAPSRLRESPGIFTSSRVFSKSPLLPALAAVTAAVCIRVLIVTLRSGNPGILDQVREAYSLQRRTVEAVVGTLRDPEAFSASGGGR